MIETSHKPRRKLSLTRLLPNLLTVAAICAGLTAIRFAFLGSFATAVALIVLAALLDGLDGRLARLLKSESEIGAELDSLADFLNFGVAPGLVVYLWALPEAGGLGWIMVLIYAICCVLRLARFNVGNRTEEGQAIRHFVGVPAPAGALLVMLPIYVSFMSHGSLAAPPALAAVFMAAVGMLMISRLPTPSLKAATVYAEHAKFVVVGFVALIAALITYPWATLTLGSLAYLAALLRSWLRHRGGRAGGYGV